MFCITGLHPSPQMQATHLLSNAPEMRHPQCALIRSKESLCHGLPWSLRPGISCCESIAVSESPRRNRYPDNLPIRSLLELKVRHCNSPVNRTHYFLPAGTMRRPLSPTAPKRGRRLHARGLPFSVWRSFLICQRAGRAVLAVWCLDHSASNTLPRGNSE